MAKTATAENAIPRASNPLWVWSHDESSGPEEGSKSRQAADPHWVTAHVVLSQNVFAVVVFGIVVRSYRVGG